MIEIKTIIVKNINKILGRDGPIWTMVVFYAFFSIISFVDFEWINSYIGWFGMAIAAFLNILLLLVRRSRIKESDRIHKAIVFKNLNKIHEIFDDIALDLNDEHNDSELIFHKISRIIIQKESRIISLLNTTNEHTIASTSFTSDDRVKINTVVDSAYEMIEMFKPGQYSKLAQQTKWEENAPEWIKNTITMGETIKALQ